MPARARAGGFSLIEVLIALVILGVGLLGLARLQLFLLANTASSAAHDNAVRLANDQLETLRFSRLSGGVPSSGSDQVLVQGQTFYRVWTVACQAEQNYPPCRADLSLRWSEPPGSSAATQRELKLISYLPAPTLAEQGWLVQSGPPHRENLP